MLVITPLVYAYYKPMFVPKNTAYFERFVSGIFVQK